MDRDNLDTLCERAILGLVLAIVVYAALATGAVKPRDFLVVQGLTILATAVWCARFWVNPSHRLQWPPICWAVVAFVIYGIWRYNVADVEYLARHQLIRVVVYALLFFIVLNNLHRQDTTQVLVLTVLCLGMLISLYALYQFLTNSRTVWGIAQPLQYRGRASGSFVYPNNLAGFLELLLPLALACVFLGKSSPAMRVLFGYIALAMLAGIGVTVSRAGWVSTGLALIVFFGLLARYEAYRKPALICLAVFALGVGLFVEKARAPQKRFSRMYIPGQVDEVSVRPALWKSTVQMWLDHVWFGVGPAHFDAVFPRYRTELVQGRPVFAHNDYLNTLADWGLVGTGLVAAALGSLYALVFKTWRFVHRAQNTLVIKRSDRAAHVFGLAIGLLAILIHSLADFNLQVPGVALLAVTMMASLSGHVRFATDNFWVTPRLLGRILATLVCGVAIGYGSVEWVRGLKENHYRILAEKVPTLVEGLAMLEQAHRVDPMNPQTVYKLAEAYRTASWEGEDNYRGLAEQAMRWYEVAMPLNPFDPYPVLRYGMCLDWLGRHGQANLFFRTSLALDPNNYYIVALQGWHKLQLGDYAAAKGWFERSLKIKSWDNSVATTYLEIVNQRLAEAEKRK